MAFRAALCVLNAKYVHASPAPWCLAAGVKQDAPVLWPDVRVVEGTVNEAPDAVLARICAEQPRLVSFSCYIWNIRETLALCAALRARLPGVTLVLGGPEVSYCAAQVLRAAPAVDYVLAGEGEHSFPVLLACLAAGGTPVPPDGKAACAAALSAESAGACPAENAAAAPGENANAFAMENAETSAVENVRVFPGENPAPLSRDTAGNLPAKIAEIAAETAALPAKTAVHPAKTAAVLPAETAAACAAVPGLCGRTAAGEVYESAPCVLTGAVPSPLAAGYAAAVRGRFAYVETSRGCPYSCAFCLSGRCGAPRWFAPEACFADIAALANAGPRAVKFVDRTFNANPAHANAILRFLLAHIGRDIPRDARFHFELAGDILREETFALLEAMPAGAVQLEIGMQSFHEPTLAAVRRKTDTALLQKNIRRLAAMQNLHLHIDLIAGLPAEDLPTFARSFNTAYALGAQMLQLGFLKLLPGSAMREEPQHFPCAFSAAPPYEVRSTPWLSEDDLAVLHGTEDALERVYNSGRFPHTAAYVLAVSGRAPFDFYTALGAAARAAGVHGGTRAQSGTGLDAYTAFLQRFCAALPGVDAALLRDALVRDRLCTNSTGRLPACLQVPDARLAQALRALAQDPAAAPQPGVRRGAALLYGARTVCWADYAPAARHPVSGRWPLREMPLAALLLPDGKGETPPASSL